MNSASLTNGLLDCEVLSKTPFALLNCQIAPGNCGDFTMIWFLSWFDPDFFETVVKILADSERTRPVCEGSRTR